MPPVHLEKLGRQPAGTARPDAVSVLGGTPNALLKLAKSDGPDRRSAC